MNPAERGKVRDGALVSAGVTGIIAYWNYRERIRKEFMRSEGYYRMAAKIENMTPWKALYFSWWRMPK